MFFFFFFAEYFKCHQLRRDDEQSDVLRRPAEQCWECWDLCRRRGTETRYSQLRGSVVTYTFKNILSSRSCLGFQAQNLALFRF